MSEFSHLDKLEAEAIYIIREVAAECEKPVMLYSIGKDSSVMLHLAMKAFYPEKPPFPFLHVNTTWKFKEMIEFRDKTAKKLGIDMIEYINEQGVKDGINPFDHGSAYTDIMKTQALKQALDKYGFTAAFGGGRRDEENQEPKREYFLSETNIMRGIRKTSVPRCGNCTIPRFRNIRKYEYSHCQTGPRRISGSTFAVKISRSRLCILQKYVRSFTATATLSW